MRQELVKTACARDCYDTCFLDAYVVGGRLNRVAGSKDSPITLGVTCPRARADPARLYSNRVLHPHVRVGGKPGGGFRRIAWDEALDLVASKLAEVLGKHGAEAVLHLEYAGNMGLLTWYYPQRLWNALGATATDYSICSRTGHEALELHYGSSHGLRPEELPNMRLVVYWGFNPAVSAVHLWHLSLKARDRGAPLVAVDPRRSETARSADLWLSPKPGTDVALAYGIARYLIEHGYVDLDFIAKRTSGYEEFRREAMRWTPERVERVTGVRWRLVEELGELYGRLKPSATLIGFGLQKSAHGAEAVRAVSLIPALLGLRRGFYYSNSRGWLIDLAYLTGEKLAGRRRRIVSQVSLGRLLARGEFKFVFVYNANPVVTLPESGLVRRGLLRDDVFVVVHDSHWTETARCADVVLPAATYLEKDDVVVPYSHGHVRMSRRVVEPLGESRDEIWVMRELAKRLGLRERWLYEDPWSALGKALSGSLDERSFRRLLEGGAVELRRRPEDEYPTPTGRVEFYSLAALKRGLPPLPVQRPVRIGGGEFVLLTSSTPRYTNTQFREVYGRVPPVVHISADDAADLGVRSGDEVELYNDRGRVVLEARVTDDVPRGVLWSPKHAIGLNGEPVSCLTPGDTQAVGGGPVFNSTLVRVRRLARASSGPLTP